MSELLLTQNVPTAKQLEGLTLADVVSETNFEVFSRISNVNFWEIAYQLKSFCFDELKETPVGEVPEYFLERAQEYRDAATRNPRLIPSWLMLIVGISLVGRTFQLLFTNKNNKT